jgi:integrase
LEAVPEAERSGPVFRPLGLRGQPCLDFDWTSRIIVRIGKAAGVKVNTDGNGKVKYASAHDLRRSFGARWAPRVMPIVLQQLMRHESIDTTLKYYVGQNAEAMADQIWEAAHEHESVGTLIGTKPNRVKRPSNEKAANPYG